MLSILIVNWNTCDLLKACLSSIFRFPPSCVFEVIVVDNASADGSAEMVKNLFPTVKLLAQETNWGYAEGNNIAFKRAKGEWLLTLNPDTEVTKGCLDHAIRQLSIRPECGSLSVRFLNPDGTPQKSIRGFPSIAGILGTLLKLDKRAPGTALDSYSLSTFAYDHSGYCDQPMGTFILFRRSALAMVGSPDMPFDRQFPIFFNEVDLLKRLADAGQKCWYTADASILHHHGGSTKQVRPSMIWESHKSLVRYFSKHLRGLSRILLPLVAVAAYGAAFARAKGYDAGFRPERNNMQLEHR